MTEEEHDAQVAPLLLEACKRAEALGGTVLCYSEYGPKQGDGFRDGCRTMVKAEDATGQAILVKMALDFRGNLDALVFGLLRAHRDGLLDLSNTCALRLLDR